MWATVICLKTWETEMYQRKNAVVVKLESPLPEAIKTYLTSICVTCKDLWFAEIQMSLWKASIVKNRDLYISIERSYPTSTLPLSRHSRGKLENTAREKYDLVINT